MSSPKLFQPIQVGDITLSHRVVMAPMTRVRADIRGVPTALMTEYYAQRASTPGTLLITDGTAVAPQAVGFKYGPGIWSEEQIVGWKAVTDAIHAQGSFTYVQLFAAGRAASPDALAEGPFPLVAPSDIPLSGTTVKPHALTVEEIKEYVDAFVTASKNAIRAGFDGVEIHAANGYLLDQFLQDTANKRTDGYGGSVERRSRLVLEVVDAVAAAIGQTRIGVRLSPWAPFGDMRMDDPLPTFTYLVTELAAHFSDLAYLSVLEPRVSGTEDRQTSTQESNDFIHRIWSPRPIIVAGGYTRSSAIETAETTGALVAFGRLFLSNPDLPVRLQKNIPALKGDRATYYTPGNPHGYIDYPFADGSVAPQQFKPNAVHTAAML